MKAFKAFMKPFEAPQSMKAFKAFKKPFESQQRSVKFNLICISIQLLEMHGI